MIMAEGFQATCEDLRNEITCSLCLETLQDPKVLSCGHVFCGTPCLESLARRSTRNTISCPQCRADTAIPGNISNLRTAFHINRLKDIVNRLEDVQIDRPPSSATAEAHTEGTVMTTPVEERCCKHPTQELELYCLKCSQVMCRDCIVIDRKHHGHDYELVSEVALKHKEKTMCRLATIEQIHKDVEQALAATSQARKDMDNDKSVLVDSISKSFGHEISDAKLLELASRKLCSEMIDSVFERICIYEEKLYLVWSELDDLIVSTRRNIFERSSVQFLSTMKDLLSHIQSLSQKLKGFSEIPVTLPYAASYICDHYRIFNGK